MRRLLLLAGLVVLAVVWAGPLLAAWRGSFSAHMVAHMGVVAVAAPLIAAGLSRADASAAPVSALSQGFLPVAAALLEFIVVWGWHAPAMRAMAEASLAVTAIEQLMFLACGLVLWTSALRPGNETAGAIGLLLTSMHMTLLGALLALSPRPLYGLSDVTCFGLTLPAGLDQQIGGVVMLAVGAAVYLAGGVFLVARMLNREPDAEVVR